MIKTNYFISFLNIKTTKTRREEGEEKINI